MTRFTEDPGTRRVVDTQSRNWRLGVDAAHRIRAEGVDAARFEMFECGVLLDEMLAEDPDVTADWGAYVVVRAIHTTLKTLLEEAP